MSLAEMRKSGKGNIMDRLMKSAAKTSAGNKNDYQKDEVWYPERDKTGNGSAIIRFLWPKDEDSSLYIERFQHGFKNNGKYYIEFCPTTLKEACPACDYNSGVIDEYGDGDFKACPDDIKQEVRDRGRNKGFSSGYYANIMVIKDPANPDNEGKVFLFNFGKIIHDMIWEMAEPVDDGINEVPEPIVVFDKELGADFTFIIRKKEGRADYSKSSFGKSTPCPDINEDDMVDLDALRAPKIFKEYDVLKKKLDYVMNTKTTGKPKTAVDAVSKVEKEDDKIREELKSKLKGAETEAVPDQMEESSFNDSGEKADTANMEYFKDIAGDIDI